MELDRKEFLERRNFAKYFATIAQLRVISSIFDGRMFLEETGITWKAKDDDPWAGTRTGQNFSKREISR